jgi:hypothetical protein
MLVAVAVDGEGLKEIEDAQVILVIDEMHMLIGAGGADFAKTGATPICHTKRLLWLEAL